MNLFRKGLSTRLRKGPPSQPQTLKGQFTGGHGTEGEVGHEVATGRAVVLAVPEGGACLSRAA